MQAKFIEGVGGKLAEQWVAALLTPAFVFWAGGLAAWVYRYGWTSLLTQFTQLSESLQIALLVATLLGVTTSAFVVQRFDFAALRYLEGYWSRWFPLRWLLVYWQKKRYKKSYQRWQELMGKRRQQELTTVEAEDLARLDWWLIHTPRQPDQLMPTRLGNILRSAELRPRNKYGLDAVICWSRLWLLLPEAVKKDLQEARADLNTAARVWLWSLLFMVWTIWAWWAAPMGIIAAIFAYYSWALDAARNYGELIEATFDTHRHLLYQSLRWDLPDNPVEERQIGQKLTEYLWRGF